MKITIMMLVARTLAHGESSGLPAERKVAVCVEGMGTPEVVGAYLKARAMTSRIFHNIGVTIGWRRGLAGCPSQAIQISLIQDSPQSLNPGAVAYAPPYEGRHICVFFDRIKENTEASQVPIVLGHVLAHEITHILQGIDRHSASGIMKARWNMDDYRGMKWAPLGFEDDDIKLIDLGLEERTAGTILGINPNGHHSMGSGQ